MPRGTFTQCFSVLLKEPVALEAVETSLAGFTVHGTYGAAEHWALSGPWVALAFRPDVNGLIMVDVVDQPWPDDMGDPQTEDLIFTAWTLGQFGPFTYPGSLQRAMQQCWGWKEGSTAPAEHRAFVRVRSSYVLGAGENAPAIPNDWDPVAELHFLTKVVDALLAMPAALCYFNPNGEILSDLAGLRSHMDHANAEGLIPIDLWMNVRKYSYDAERVLMDTIGNGQLNETASGNLLSELRDAEALFRVKAYDYGEVADFLRELTLHLHKRGDVIQDGDTIADGPGNVPWRATLPEKSIAMPPRRVLHMTPLDGSVTPSPPA